MRFMPKWFSLLGVLSLSGWGLACVSNESAVSGSGGVVAGSAGTGVGGTASGGATNGGGGGVVGSGGSGTGGRSTGSGGAVGTGGNISVASGGATGAAGATGSSGGAGGRASTGGRTGTGGGSDAGGRLGSGGTTAGTGGAAGSGGATEPPQKTVRVFWLRPSDVPFDQKYPDGIGKVMIEAQKYYLQELGKTFKLNTQIVETVVGEHVKIWYETTANGSDKYWWSVFNMRDELVRRFKFKQPDSRWMIVGEISAEGDGAGGGGNVGWVMLCQHDADGAAGIGGTANRWYGGMVHELGHAFGLPDSTSTDGTPMSASLYDYPNTHFSQSQKNSILNGPSASFLF